MPLSHNVRRSLKTLCPNRLRNFSSLITATPIGALLSLKEQWQKVDRIRILMGNEVSLKTKRAFSEGLRKVTNRLEGSLESIHSLMKRGVIRVYHHWSPHICTVTARNFNRRKMTESERTIEAFRKVEGKRLMYKSPTKRQQTEEETQ